jgi:asparagine N-glycosylation enzyme membrane subunit Stt3
VIFEDGPERRPQTLGGVVYLIVVATALAGLAITVLGAWRTGVIWMGVSLLVGGAARLALPERQAGMLRVRRKASDVVMLVLAGAVLVVLAIVVPDQPT